MTKWPKVLTFWAFVTFVFYWAAVLLSGLGINIFGQNLDFSASGQFGDSFGPLTALMSMAAATSAFLAYQSQREDLKIAKSENEAAKYHSYKRDFENTFFNLLNLFSDTLKQIDVKGFGDAGTLRGADAFSHMVNRFMVPSFYEEGPINLDSRYIDLVQEYKNDISHYFRLFYYIIKYIDESEIEDKLFYIRILRAILSNIEMILIGLNCVYGSKQPKLKSFVEKYAILHNVSSVDARQFNFAEKFDHAAFGDRRVLEDGGLD